jgi:phosphate starvation-inducible PhoH-like protein
LRILNDVKGIGVCEFSSKDVVRHPLVMRIIEAYERDDVRRYETRKSSQEEDP